MRRFKEVWSVIGKGLHRDTRSLNNQESWQPRVGEQKAEFSALKNGVLPLQDI